MILLAAAAAADPIKKPISLGDPPTFFGFQLQLDGSLFVRAYFLPSEIPDWAE